MTPASSVLTLRTRRGWAAIDFVELSRFRHLLIAFAWRDLKLRYKQTLLGVAWVVLQPLVGAGIFNFVFGTVAGLKPAAVSSYFVFSFAGLLAWNLFGGTLNKAALSMVGNGHLISKVYFPRLILPLAGAASTLIDFVVSGAVMATLLVAAGIWPGWPIYLLPVWMALLLALALGAGLIAAALTVEYRDVQHMLPIAIPFLLYASPVAYDVAHLPVRYRHLYYLANPLASIIEAFRWSLLGSSPPPGVYLTYSVACSAGLFVAGAAIFRRMERRIADVI